MTPKVQESPPITALLRPFQRFQRLETAGGILLIACTGIALFWANSPWADTYEHLLHIPLTAKAGDFEISKSLLHWINDALMAIFFFVVGLEIKRELLVGELASPSKALLPACAAIGGMAGPALIFAAINWNGDGIGGWGIPMATDIAFAIGVLSLLGKRVPLGLKVFLTALAIVDDIGAVLVIAVFYTEDLSTTALGFAGGFLALMIATNLLGVRKPLIYLLLGICLWIAFLKSGVHATVAGVLGAFAIPASLRINEQKFLNTSRSNLEQFEHADRAGKSISNNETKQAAVHHLEQACENVQPPLLRIEHALVPWVVYFIMPIFALANAGISVKGDFLDALREPVAVGIGLGLIFGNQIGIFLATWLCVRLGLSTLPAGCTWRHIYGAACLAGIGFTMSLFIANLAFDADAQLPISKVGILTGSFIAAIIGLLVLRFAAAPAPRMSQSADERNDHDIHFPP